MKGVKERCIDLKVNDFICKNRRSENDATKVLGVGNHRAFSPEVDLSDIERFHPQATNPLLLKQFGLLLQLVILLLSMCLFPFDKL